MGTTDNDDIITSTGVRVVVRIRPLLTHERTTHTCDLLQLPASTNPIDDSDLQYSKPSSESINENTVRVQVKSNVHTFAFDSVLTPSANQTDVYEAGNVDHMIRAVMKGYHATIFACKSQLSLPFYFLLQLSMVVV